jgi:Zn-dependent M16 (insulinase) family peptidase
MHLEYQKTFDFLKEAVDQGYFEDLVRNYLLDNPHEAVITLVPEANKTLHEEKELAERLEEYKKSLSKKEINRLIRETKALKKYQETPDSKEALETIPMLSRADINRTAEKLSYEVREESGIKVIYTNVFTSGIGYVRLLFDTSCIPIEDMVYVGFLKSVLGYVDTEKYSYEDLTSEIYLNSGGMDCLVSSYIDLNNPGQFKGAFEIKAKALYHQMAFPFEIVAEILNSSKLDDEKRLGEILKETRSRARMRMENGLHAAAVSRATSYFSASSVYNELTGGIQYYRFLEYAAEQFEKDPKFRRELIGKLKEVKERLFVRNNLMVSYASGKEGYSVLAEPLRAFVDSLPMGDGKTYPFVCKFKNYNEGFKTSSQVNYVARCGSFAGTGLEYTGALKVLKIILNYEYLWANLRVKGGAYGCMSGFGRSGEGFLVSYRDPQLEETNKIYEGIPEYLRNFSIDERDMTKYVIGAISGLDTPMTPAIQASRNLSAYMSGVTDEMFQKERDQILDVTQEDIRKLADIVQAVLDTGAFCTIGNEHHIMEKEGMFQATENLYH